MTEQLQLRRGTAAQVAAFTGAQGEVVVDTTNNRLVVNDGATTGGWPHALATRTAVSDAAYAALVTDRIVAYTALTAARIVTLPAAASYPGGAQLTIIDETGNCSVTKTITAARAGSDTIDGAASAVISAPYSVLSLESNGSNAWTIVHARGQGGVNVIGQSHIPFILPSSGSMGNNGALSGITSLPATYASAYVYLPAGAIASGSTAGWYYAVFSSTTAATVYNNVYSSGTPAIPASPTAFSTTGPGAFTQTTASFIAAYTLSIAGNTLGANGAIEIIGGLTMASSTNAKTFEGAYGAYAFGSNNISASGTVSAGICAGFANRAVTNSQVALTALALGTAGSSGTPSYGAIDSTQSQNLTIQLKLASASDFIVLESIVAKLIPGVP